MNSSVFWRLIEEAKAEADGDPFEQCDLLIDKLSSFAVPDILTWALIFDEYQRLSYRQRLWSAAYIMNGGCSDDGFDYFRGWLISRGREVFTEALRDPDSLADAVGEDEGEFECENMLGIGSDAYFRKLEIDDYDYDRYYAELGKRELGDGEKAAILAELRLPPDADEEWDEEDLPKLFPRLWAKFS